MLTVAWDDPHADEKLRALEGLYSVIDPELFVNIVDLGLIYDLDFDKEEVIRVTMTLTTPHCPMGDAIQNGVTNVLGDLFPEKKTDINLIFEPLWSFDQMTEEGKRQLGV